MYFVWKKYLFTKKISESDIKMLSLLLTTFQLCFCNRISKLLWLHGLLFIWSRPYEGSLKNNTKKNITRSFNLTSSVTIMSLHKIMPWLVSMFGASEINDTTDTSLSAFILFSTRQKIDNEDWQRPTFYENMRR